MAAYQCQGPCTLRTEKEGIFLRLAQVTRKGLPLAICEIQWPEICKPKDVKNNSDEQWNNYGDIEICKNLWELHQGYAHCATVTRQIPTTFSY